MIRVVEEADWPAVLEVHRLAFGEEDVPRIVTELREARLRCRPCRLSPWPTGAWSETS